MCRSAERIGTQMEDYTDCNIFAHPICEADKSLCHDNLSPTVASDNTDWVTIGNKLPYYHISTGVYSYCDAVTYCNSYMIPNCHLSNINPNDYVFLTSLATDLGYKSDNKFSMWLYTPGIVCPADNTMSANTISYRGPGVHMQGTKLATDHIHALCDCPNIPPITTSPTTTTTATTTSTAATTTTATPTTTKTPTTTTTTATTTTKPTTTTTPTSPTIITTTTTTPRTTIIPIPTTKILPTSTTTPTTTAINSPTSTSTTRTAAITTPTITITSKASPSSTTTITSAAKSTTITTTLSSSKPTATNTTIKTVTVPVLTTLTKESSERKPMTGDDKTWTLIGRQEYYVNYEVSTYEQAKSYCHSLNSTLFNFRKTIKYFAALRNLFLPSGSYWIDGQEDGCLIYTQDQLTLSISTCQQHKYSICGRNPNMTTVQQVLEDPLFVGMLEDMIVQKNTTSKSIRKHICVHDNRKSAQAAGGFGVFIIVVTISLLVLSDLTHLISYVNKRLYQQPTRPESPDLSYINFYLMIPRYE